MYLHRFIEEDVKRDHNSKDRLWGRSLFFCIAIVCARKPPITLGNNAKSCFI